MSNVFGAGAPGGLDPAMLQRLMAYTGNQQGGSGVAGFGPNPNAPPMAPGAGFGVNPMGGYGVNPMAGAGINPMAGRGINPAAGAPMRAPMPAPPGGGLR